MSHKEEGPSNIECLLGIWGLIFAAITGGLFFAALIAMVFFYSFYGAGVHK